MLLFSIGSRTVGQVMPDGSGRKETAWWGKQLDFRESLED